MKFFEKIRAALFGKNKENDVAAKSNVEPKVSATAQSVKPQVSNTKDEPLPREILEPYYWMDENDKKIYNSIMERDTDQLFGKLSLEEFKEVVSIYRGQLREYNTRFHAKEKFTPSERYEYVHLIALYKQCRTHQNKLAKRRREENSAEQESRKK